MTTQTAAETAIADGVAILAKRLQEQQSRLSKLNESETLNTLIRPMLRRLGWDDEDISQVRTEYRRLPSSDPVDVALMVDGAPSLFVEAKAVDLSLHDPKWISQTLNYANTCNVPWAVLTNGREWRVYKTHAEAVAEDKLFYAIHVDGDIEEAVRQFLPLARSSVTPRRALDAMWERSCIDLEVVRLINALPDNMRALKAIAGESAVVTPKKLAEALRRMRMRIEPDTGFGSCGTGVEDDSSPLPITTVSTTPPLAPAVKVNPTRDDALELMRAPAMFKAGLLRAGQVLRLRGRPGSEATVVDERHVRYRGQVMVYNQWGMAVTGWTAIQIYKHAETEGGVLLDELRRTGTKD